MSKVAVTVLAPVMIAAAFSGTEPTLPAQKACEEKARARFGTVTVISSATPAPPKLKSVAPKLPIRTKGTPAGIWMGVAMVEPQGKVAEIWQARGLQPDFDVPIVEAIRPWQYKPLLVGGRAVPFCVTLSVRIEVR